MPINIDLEKVDDKRLANVAFNTFLILLSAGRYQKKQLFYF
jgi:hypothetical protein